MAVKIKGGVLSIKNKKLNALDRFVLDFIRLIGLNYVIVSGYVAILLGRSRNTEDIDILIRNEGPAKFAEFYNRVISTGKYWAINATDAKDAYELMTVDKSSLRFAEKGTTEPNFEIKFADKSVDYYSLDNALNVDFGMAKRIKISPIELEIAYKLFLGGEKDFADAKHLFVFMNDSLDIEKLKAFIRELNIKKGIVRKVLGSL